MPFPVKYCILTLHSFRKTIKAKKDQISKARVRVFCECFNTDKSGKSSLGSVLRQFSTGSSQFSLSSSSSTDAASGPSSWSSEDDASSTSADAGKLWQINVKPARSARAAAETSVDLFDLLLSDDGMSAGASSAGRHAVDDLPQQLCNVSLQSSYHNLLGGSFGTVAAIPHVSSFG